MQLLLLQCLASEMDYRHDGRGDRGPQVYSSKSLVSLLPRAIRVLFRLPGLSKKFVM